MELIERWEEYISFKNAFAYGDDAEIDVDDFSDLVKESYNYIKIFIQNYKSDDEQIKTITYESFFDFSFLVSCINRYSGTEGAGNEVYKTTMIVANILVHEANIFANFDVKLCAIADDYWYSDDLSEEEMQKVYTYDIEKGDLTEIIELSSIVDL